MFKLQRVQLSHKIRNTMTFEEVFHSTVKKDLYFYEKISPQNQN